MDNMINSVGNVNRVSYLSNKAAMNTGPNIQSMVRENKQFLSVAESIQQRVVSDFEKAEEHAQSYESFKQIYDFNVAWDFEAYRAQQHDSSSLKVTLELIGNWSKDLEKLRNKPIGILEVDSKRLKGELNPLREARLQEIKDYIKDIARIRCSQLLDSYKDNLIKLSSKPTHLKEFANQVQTIVTLKEDEKSLYKKTSQVISVHQYSEQRFLIIYQNMQVDQLYNLLRQYEVKVPSEDLVLHEDLHERQQEYRREIEIAQAYRDSKVSEMVVAVEGNIMKLQDQIAGMIAKLDDPIFIDCDYFDEPEKMIEELNQVGQRLENADQMSKNYASYQKLFNVPVTQQKELETGKERWEAVKQLWETVRWV